MWGIHEDNKVVGFQHGLEKSSKWDMNDTRVLFLTEGIIMLIKVCLPPNTPTVRDNIELAVRAIITLHHKFAKGYPRSQIIH